MQKLEVRLKQIPMPELPVEERIKTFEEVPLGYNEEQALAEAARCLQCDHPLCVEMCPLNIDVLEFIRFVKLGRYEEAVKKVREKNCLPSVCGRVCPQEKLCMMGCKHTIGDAVNVGGLERFVGDWGLEKGLTPFEIPESTGKSVAVIGSGPAGLTAASELALMGHYVTIFEALHEAGGVLTYGIPGFRLAKKIVNQEIDQVRKLGVNIKTNIIIGRTMTLDELSEEGYDSVFLGTGAGLPKLLDIPGENLCGVFSLNEFLLRINLMRAYNFPHKSRTPIKVQGKVAVLGPRGVDAARCALRLDAEEACIFYQRNAVGREDDKRRAKEEGVKFQPLSKPLRLSGDAKNWVKQIEFMKLKFGPLGKFGRPRILRTKEKFLYDAETVVIATEHIPNTLALRNTSKKIEIEEKNKIIVIDPETLETTQEGIFASGDVASGAASVINAIERTKRAAQSINRYLYR